MNAERSQEKTNFVSPAQMQDLRRSINGGREKILAPFFARVDAQSQVRLPKGSRLKAA